MKYALLQRFPLIVASALILLFAYTASAKLYDQVLFESVLSQSPWLRPYATFLSWGVPCVELVIVALLYFPSSRRLGLFASFALLSSFTVYIIAMLLFSPHLPCMCGGIISSMSWGAHLGVNAVLAGLSFWSAKANASDDMDGRTTLT
jgi:Ni/Fe-hydrogenase subunit HybB-like protein